VFFGTSNGDIYEKHSGMMTHKLINEARVLNANKKITSLLPVIVILKVL
jgi:hypothetical protein